MAQGKKERIVVGVGACLPEAFFVRWEDDCERGRYGGFGCWQLAAEIVSTYLMSTNLLRRARPADGSQCVGRCSAHRI